MIGRGLPGCGADPGLTSRHADALLALLATLTHHPFDADPLHDAE